MKDVLFWIGGSQITRAPGAAELGMIKGKRGKILPVSRTTPAVLYEKDLHRIDRPANRQPYLYDVPLLMS